MNPEIGVKRCYPPGPLPVLYPGEQATAVCKLGPAELDRLADGGSIDLADTVDGGWVVTPTPGLWGWWLRTRYRLGVWWRDG